jgi:hypothetical protein
MKFKRIILVSFFISYLTCQGYAQLPSMDIQIKSGLTTLLDMRDKDNNIYNYLSPVIFGELNYNISQHFAVGVYYSKGIGGQTEFIPDFSDTDTEFYNSSHQCYGFKIRASTGRQPRFRPFIELTYGKFEMFIEKDFYRVANSSNYFGWSMGLMLRLNGKFYLVLPQVSFRTRTDPFYFEVPGDFVLGSYPPIIEITGGVSYNFGKKK